MSTSLPRSTTAALLALAVLCLAGCGGPDPRQQSATTALLAKTPGSSRVFPAPGEWKPLPAAAGSWILLRHDYPKRKETAVHRMSVVRNDAGGFVLESEVQDYHHHTISQMHFSRQPTTPDESIDLLQKMVSSSDGGAPAVSDFSSGPMAAMKGLMKRSMGDVMSQIDGAPAPGDAPKEDATVPAGVFKGAARIHSEVTIAGQRVAATSWFHPAVPLSGQVRSVSDDGESTTELLDFGTSGAKASF